ncbi:MAG: DUF4062 domain-containing protein [Streptosporangiaceae bacterium]
MRESCLDDVGRCDLYVLILGHRYGSSPQKTIRRAECCIDKYRLATGPGCQPASHAGPVRRLTSGSCRSAGSATLATSTPCVTGSSVPAAVGSMYHEFAYGLRRGDKGRHRMKAVPTGDRLYGGSHAESERLT